MTDYVISDEWLNRLSEIDYGNCDIANRIVAMTLHRPLSDELKKILNIWMQCLKDNKSTISPEGYREHMRIIHKYYFGEP